MTSERSRVFLIGGSNSIAFTPHVRDHLMYRATVNRVPDNARSTRYTLEHLDDWLGTDRWDLIHFNWGMHDLTRVDGRTPQVSLQEYVANLECLVPRLRTAGDQLVWGTILYMVEERQPKRRLRDVNAYNKAARKVMARLNVPVHDLYQLTAQRPELLGSDGLHLTPEGCEVVGRDLATVIDGHLLDPSAPSDRSPSGEPK
jgi:lysophospholipase L1-like esterase